ncbi:MAG TPA: hypothetical protein VJP02_05035 [Candidatus Sulfotelmatobacter sp.]|nr:hypothetical protein [Candidatus Sulfotelmatobacter sp.]
MIETLCGLQRRRNSDFRFSLLHSTPTRFRHKGSEQWSVASDERKSALGCDQAFQGRAVGLRLALILLALCILFPPAADAQLEHGTVVVFIVSSSKAVIAADGRYLAPHEPPNDHACKIIALGSQFLFAESGINLGSPTMRAPDGRSQQEAIRAFARFQVSKANHSDPVDQISSDWLSSMKPVYQRALKSYRRDILQYEPSGFLVSAAFVGLNPTGRIEGRAIDIYFDLARLKKGFSKLIIHNNPSWQITIQPSTKVLGHAEIIDSFSHLSAEAREDTLANWKIAHPDLDLAYFLVDYTESYAPADYGVGGPIDEVAIFPHSGIEWLHRKPGCPANSAIK